MIKKSAPLAILKILEETDENNPLTRVEIERKLHDVYGISIERRTVYSNIELLESYGYEISKPSDNKSDKYYLVSRGFEESEIKLLCNAIHSSRFIPVNYSKDLIKKLLLTQSKAFRKEYNDEVFIDNGDKKENRDFFLNIDTISDAIKNKKNISYDYMKYDTNFKLVKRDEIRKQVSPYYLIYTSDKIYLAAYSQEHKMVIHLRVDKMMNIQEEDGKYVSESKKKDPYQYARTKMYMFAGEDITVTLRFKESVLDDIVDSFGRKLTLIKDGEGYYKTNIKTSEQGIIYYALQYIDNIEILEPKDIRNKVKEALSRGLKAYK